MRAYAERLFAQLSAQQISFFMLLLTDRPDQGRHFQKIFGQVRPCEMVRLDEATSLPADQTSLACHADLTDPQTRQLLDAALTHHRASIDMPVLFVVPDDEIDARTEATAFGATEILPENASRERLLFTMRRIMRTQRRETATAAVRPETPQASIEQIGGALSKLLNAAGRRETLSIAVLDQGADALLTSIRQNEIKGWLAVVRRYDNVTFQHCLLVAGLVTAFAQRLALTPAMQRMLARAALLHDIGKAQIPLTILNKNGPLNADEMKMMRTHPVIGHQMLVGSGIDPAILDIVRHHHEYIDGSGYPDRLRGTQVTEPARIVTICDIYGALLERRAYKPQRSPLEARAILHDMGGKLDATFLKAFDTVIKDC